MGVWVGVSIINIDAGTFLYEYITVYKYYNYQSENTVDVFFIYVNINIINFYFSIFYLLSKLFFVLFYPRRTKSDTETRRTQGLGKFE